MPDGKSENNEKITEKMLQSLETLHIIKYKNTQILASLLHNSDAYQ